MPSSGRFVVHTQERDTTTNATTTTLTGEVTRVASKHSRFGSYLGITLKLEDGSKAWFKRSRDAFELNVGDHVEVTGDIEWVNDLRVVNHPLVHADAGDYGVGHDSHIDEGFPSITPAITPSACLHIGLRRISQEEQLYVCLGCRYLFRSAATLTHFDDQEPEPPAPQPEPAAPQSYSAEKDAFLSQFLNA